MIHMRLSCTDARIILLHVEVFSIRSTISSAEFIHTVWMDGLSRGQQHFSVKDEFN
jgi:hypothetical protein